jgi:hypothetical protein
MKRNPACYKIATYSSPLLALPDKECFKVTRKEIRARRKPKQMPCLITPITPITCYPLMCEKSFRLKVIDINEESSNSDSEVLNDNQNSTLSLLKKKSLDSSFELENKIEREINDYLDALKIQKV